MSSLRESLSAIAMWSDAIVRYHAAARQKLARDGEPFENDFARAHDPATLGDCDQSSWVFTLWQLQRCVDRFFLAWESANDQLDGLADLAIPDFAHWKHGLRKLLIRLPRWLDRDVRWTITRDCPQSWHSQISAILELQDDLLATGDLSHHQGMMVTIVPGNATEETETTPAAAGQEGDE